MAIRVALHHHTRYDYDRLVTLGPHVIRLRPAPHTPSPIVAYSLKVEPDGHFINWHQDPNSNYLARLAFPEPTRALDITVDLVADLSPINPFDFFLEEEVEETPIRYPASVSPSLKPFLDVEPPGPRLQKMLDTVDRTPRRTIDFLVELNQTVHARLAYTLRLDPGVFTPEETLERGEGSCRDFAWLMVHLLRHLGIAARFVSGYSIQLRPDETPVDPDAPAGVSEDTCDLHAWCEAYLPGAGWVGLDPTSGLFCGEGHIPLATSPNTAQAAPIEGKLSSCKTSFDVSMSVRRIHEDPRVTKPVSDGQWAAILALGDQVDADLHANDVRLTMGGEPTFVSLKDPDHDVWNTAAVGHDKKKQGEALLHRLRETFAPGSIVHVGQGKWYPGEPLPRWALSLYWRKDGVPMWSNDQVLARETSPRTATNDDAKRLVDAIAKSLQIHRDYVHTAYEDPIFAALRERKRPVNIEPDDPRLDRPWERARLRELMEVEPGAPTGYFLPLERTWHDNAAAWQSGMWMVRGQIFLAPGDSPIGLRLPLKQLPWMDEEDAPYAYAVDPLSIDRPLPAPRPRIAHQTVEPDAPTGDEPQNRMPEPGESAHWVVRTALCAEAREGQLYVFMPPVRAMEDYLELTGVVERVAEDLGLAVLIEGYPPPADGRVNELKVTPDPGVLEINIHPASSWRELVHNTEVLYEEARRLYLGTSKFQLDGRHTGTGGGNHIVLGGSTPADSPFLRRPDLLKSVLGFWINHPSMSYLFSGLFIGPTSQAPRVDEGRVDATRELEIAFRQIPPPGTESLPLWLVDRIFRHLLTDLTGNTHRSEICIDKLYSPDGPSGRLGLVEFRGFEMPPHARMSLTQQLLVRALVAKFWQTPYDEPLQHFGLELHDKYLLPHFVWEDFAAVLNTLDHSGYGFQSDWFISQFEFRFAVIGTVELDGMQLELRQAIEPWLVLGEEQSGGGTARYVDSSLERIQLRITGLDPDTHLVAVNGIEVPLTPIGQGGLFVAGIRFRAWQPPNCLHPQIPVHSPLVFDVVERQASRAVAGCTYYISHPGGRAHDHSPVNALEAETRRAERFQPFGHNPGILHIRQPKNHPPGQVTLDLRRNS